MMNQKTVEPISMNIKKAEGGMATNGHNKQQNACAGPVTGVFSFKLNLPAFQPFGSRNTMANVIGIRVICSLPQGWGIHHVLRNQCLSSISMLEPQSK